MKATLLPIYDHKGTRVDRGIFIYYKAPKSYTGEDVVEISCHGNPLICKTIINTAKHHGLRIAEPGEYTKRAFLNGKLSLSQAESVSLLISSRTKEALKINMQNLGGKNEERVVELKEQLIDTLSLLEYELDVSEGENTTKKTKSMALKMLKNISLTIKQMVFSYRVSSVYNNGLKIAIVGKPNVGKSTLMNAISKKDRSIVSPRPGTTRDVVSVEIVLFGLPITLIDTAGIRDAEDEIEKEGVSRSVKETTGSNLVLSVFTSNTQPVENIEFRNKILVYNKADLKKNNSRYKEAISVSALKEKGIEKLLKKIQSTLLETVNYSGDVIVNTQRQSYAISKCLTFINKSSSLLKEDFPHFELVAQDLRDAINCLDLFLGKTTSDDILNNVFSSFCVGK
tara:strand:- start:66 stop:1256 length:1191 start_codon:yes stop_codon:yes gene_type:complete